MIASISAQIECTDGVKLSRVGKVRGVGVDPQIRHMLSPVVGNGTDIPKRGVKVIDDQERPVISSRIERRTCEWRRSETEVGVVGRDDISHARASPDPASDSV